MENLLVFLKKDLNIPTYLIPEVSKYFRIEEFSKSDFLVKQKYYCQKMSYIESGYFRFYSSSKEKLITHWIFGKGQLVTDISSFFLNEPAKWNIEALTYTKVYTINRDNYKLLKSSVNKWQSFESVMLIRFMSGLENRVYSFLSMSSEERYNYLFKSHPTIFNEVPLHYIASMLGMSAETLSRIRNASKS